MDPNQEGQPVQGGSVPPASPAPGMPPAQDAAPLVPPTGTPPEAGGQPETGMPPEPAAGGQPASPVFSAGQTMPNAAMPGADPSQTVPTAMPGVAPTAAPGIASAQPARPTSRFSFHRPSQSMQSAQPMQSTQPTADGSQIIASGSTTPAGGGKKLSKGMIIGIVIIVILIIAAVVVGIIASGSSSNKSSNSSNSASTPVNMSELSTAYNNLANYIAFGDENQGEGKLDDGKTYSTYDVLSFASSNHIAMSILEADKKLDEGASAEKTDYFSKLEQLYQRLPNGLYENYDVAASNISNYYQGFSSINIITLGGILSRYNVEGLESTRTYINNATKSDSDKEYVRRYASYLTEYDLAFLDLINDVKINQGCTIDLNNLSVCNLSAAASYGAFVSAQNNIQIGDAYKLRSEYQKLAVDALLGIHKAIYGSGEGATE